MGHSTLPDRCECSLVPVAPSLLSNPTAGDLLTEREG